MAKKTHRVSFIAQKPVSKEVDVKFGTRNGPVSFEAHKTVKEPVRVSFKAKEKR